MYIDSHCHLDRIDLKDFDNNFNQMMVQIQQAEVERMLCVSISLEEYPAMRALVQSYDAIRRMIR